MIQQAISKLVSSKSLSIAEAKEVMDEIMSGSCSEALIASYLTALSAKGFDADEISGSALSMKEHAKKLDVCQELLEIVGTGGDHSNSFNISTTSSIVAAAGGCSVAKHGNRAATSKCGAADCLEALGVNIQLEPEQAKNLLEKTGICFLFAPCYHPAMKYAAPVRKALSIPTIFNVLGPLTNPASASYQLMGVYDPSLLEPMARTLQKLGVKKGMVVCGEEPLDEISAAGFSHVCEFDENKIERYKIHPSDFGYEACSLEELQGDDAENNAQITRNILNGTIKGAKRQAVCLNAGASLYISGKADSLYNGVRLAEKLIDSKKALGKLDEFIEVSHAC